MPGCNIPIVSGGSLVRILSSRQGRNSVAAMRLFFFSYTCPVTISRLYREGRWFESSPPDRAKQRCSNAALFYFRIHARLQYPDCIGRVAGSNPVLPTGQNSVAVMQLFFFFIHTRLQYPDCIGRLAGSNPVLPTGQKKNCSNATLFIFVHTRLQYPDCIGRVAGSNPPYILGFKVRQRACK